MIRSFVASHGIHLHSAEARDDSLNLFREVRISYEENHLGKIWYANTGIWKIKTLGKRPFFRYASFKEPSYAGLGIEAQNTKLCCWESWKYIWFLTGRFVPITTTFWHKQGLASLWLSLKLWAVVSFLLDAKAFCDKHKMTKLGGVWIEGQHLITHLNFKFDSIC